MYESGPAGRVPTGRFSLPGILAPTVLVETEDGYGRRVGVIHHRSTGRATVVIETEPDGAALVDQEDQDRRVASWGAWHAQLAEEPGLLACTVTIETAPATASRLRDTMGRRIDPRAPPLAKEIVAEVVAARRRRGAADITGYIALTYAIRRAGRRRSIEDTAVEIASRLPGLTHGLLGDRGGDRPAGVRAAAVRDHPGGV